MSDCVLRQLGITQLSLLPPLWGYVYLYKPDEYPHNGGMKRRICEFQGCNKQGRNKGHYKGQTRYDRFCETHHRARYGAEKRMYYYEKQSIPNTTCSSCGWDKAPCDRHRIERAKGYVQENIIVLCPNCHRLKHLVKL